MRTKSRRRLALEPLEPRQLLAANPIITELMAGNTESYPDGSDPPRFEDWIEIFNAGDEPLDLAGWHLTDRADDLDQWTFPSVELDAGAFLVVFASGDGVPDAGGNLHTNFRLNTGGEYLALVRPDLTVAGEFAPEFPEQVADVSYGLAAVDLLSAGASANYLVPSDDTLADTWLGPAFDDSLWDSGPMPLGYDQSEPPAVRDPVVLYSEPFDTDAADSAALFTAYPDFTNTLSGDAGAAVTDGQVVLSGINVLLRVPGFPPPIGGSLVIEADVGASNSNGNYNVGLSIGQNQIVFHPGFSAGGGAFRVEGPGGFGNSDMGFTPANGALHHFRVEQFDSGLFEIEVTDANDPGNVYTASFTNPGSVGGPIGFRKSGGVNLPAEVGLYDNLTITAQYPPSTEPSYGFQYSFSETTVLPSLVDQSPGGHDGIASPGAVLSTDVPTTGVPGDAGNRSLNTANGGARANAIDLLNNTAIAEAGGFTMETWFKYNGDNGVTFSKILDYAGTEGLLVDTATDNLQFRINSAAGQDSLFGPITPDQWYYVAVVFDTQGTPAVFDPNRPGEFMITGMADLYMDGALVNSTGPLTINGLGDVLNRQLGIGANNGGGTGEKLNGLVFEPRVSLGALSESKLLYNAESVVGAVDFRDQIATDVELAMAGINTSIYVRSEFNLDDPAALETLSLQVQYDDAFVAYLNGTEIARRNAPDPARWNSAAPADRVDELALALENIDVSGFAPVLLQGDNVLAIHAMNSAEAGDENFLIAAQLSGINTGAAMRYFDTPTPGGPNGDGFLGFVGDTQFSVDRGFYDAADLDPGGVLENGVAITADTAGAAIVFTVDGSTPEVDDSGAILNGTEYTGPIAVTGITTLRAAAFLSEYRPSNVDTQTYLFLDDVRTQSPDGTPPPGWPAGPINGQVFDYGMDPEIVDDPAWSAQVKDALSAIPSLSLVTGLDNLFDPATGIYVNAGARGDPWEVPTSVEMLNADASKSFQANAGLRIRGGFSRTGNNPKHSLRLVFRGKYGDANLDFPLFGDEGADRFDHVDLRTAQNYAWSLDSSNDARRNSFLRDIFSRDLQREQGQAYTRGDYLHLYINGQYWGLYQTEERPKAPYAASYFGGAEEDWDAIKVDRTKQVTASDGSLDAFNALWTMADAGFDTDAAYYAVQGKDPDGTDNPNLPVYLDVDNLIDLMLSVIFAGNRDAPTSLGNNRANNFWAIRDKTSRDGFRFLLHDNEHSMLGVNDDITGPVTATQMEYNNPQFLHQRMMAHPEYRMRFADRVREYFFNGGIMTTEAATALLQSRADEISQAIIAESARWGDEHEAVPYTKDTWQAEADWLTNTFLAQRNGIVLDQLRNAGLYPDLAAPDFSQYGGQVTEGFELGMTVDISTVYTDTPLIETGDAAMVYIPTDDSLGLTWTATDYSTDAAWFGGATGVGYERDNGYQNWIATDLDIDSKMAASTSAFVRVNFTHDIAQPIDMLTLRMKYDDGFIAYLNGTEVYRSPNVTNDVPGTATATNHEAGADFEEFDVTAFKSLLQDGNNVLAIHGINYSIGSSDFLVLPELVAQEVQTVSSAPIYFTTDGTDPRLPGGAVNDAAAGGTALGYTDPIALAETTRVKARTLLDGQWSAMTEAVFVINPATGGNLAVSEIMYNPADPAITGPEAAFTDNDDFEFIELLNTSPTDTIDLTGVRFVDGVDFAFSPETAITALAPGDRVLVVRNAAAMAVRYGAGIESAIAGEYTGGLKNGGETVRIEDAAAVLVVELAYKDGPKWPQEADGGGSSLEAISVGTDLSEWESWYDSVQPGGSPGVAATAAVVSRYVYYAGSTLDDGTPAGEDRSIATDKTALLPGQTATFGNYTNFGAGLTGVMVDLAHAPQDTPIDAFDFAFALGNDDTPGLWQTIAASSIEVREGAGRGGADRVVLSWSEDVPKNRWLQVRILGGAAHTPTTGLLADDVFYFGNAIGETGNGAGNALVNAADVIAIRDNPRGSLNPASIDDPHDVNRDSFVNAVDVILARDNAAGPLTALRWITPAAAPAAPVAHGESGKWKVESGGSRTIAAAKLRRDDGIREYLLGPHEVAGL